MILDTHSTLIRLRSFIRAQETASREHRQSINALRAEGPASGPLRSLIHQRKQALGRDTRAALLALAVVRGRAYRSAEATAREPVPCFDIARILLDVVPVDPVTRHVTDAYLRCINESLAIEAWAKGGPSPIEAPAVAVAA